MKRRVIAVVRVSTPGQAGEDKYGQERQRHDIKQTAQAQNLEIVRWVEVVESGSSAFNGEDFKQVFADLARPDIAGVVVAAIDRLVRPGFLGDLQVFDHFQRNRKLIFTPGQVVDVESEAGWLVSGMFGLSAGMEKRAIVKRTAGAKERMRAAGKHPGGDSLLPHGLDYVRERDENGKVVKAYWQYGPDAINVRKAYDLLFGGTSYEEIAQRSGLDCTGRGVALILRNTVWKGIRTYPPNSLRAVPLEKSLGIEPLISPTRWAAAQQLMDEKRNATRARKRQQGDVSLALGLLRCECGRFHYLQRDPRPGQQDLFFCASRRPGPSCGAPTLRRVEAEGAVERAIMENFSTVKVVLALFNAAKKQNAKPPRNVGKIEHELVQRAAERKRLIDLCVKGLITTDEFELRARKLDADTRDLEAALPKPEFVMDQRAAATTTVGLLAQFPYLTRPDQHALVRRVFLAFDVAEGGGGIAGAVMREMADPAYIKNGTRPTPWS